MSIDGYTRITILKWVWNSVVFSAACLQVSVLHCQRSGSPTTQAQSRSTQSIRSCFHVAITWGRRVLSRIDISEVTCFLDTLLNFVVKICLV